MDKPCVYCGVAHSRPLCPNVAAIEYHPDRTVKRVEFVVPPSWPNWVSQTPVRVGTPTTFVSVSDGRLMTTRKEGPFS